MPGTPPQRNWDKEMAEVDKLLAKLPSHAAEPRPGGRPGAVAGQAAASAGSKMAAWLRVGLGVALALGMTQWPYAHSCGWPLAFYLLGIGTVVVWGVWGLFLSWRRRLPIAHLLSFGILLTGLMLAATAVLPRIGYAKEAATWFCPGP